MKKSEEITAKKAKIVKNYADELHSTMTWMSTYMDMLDKGLSDNRAHTVQNALEGIKDHANKLAYFARKATDHANEWGAVEEWPELYNGDVKEWYENVTEEK